MVEKELNPNSLPFTRLKTAVKIGKVKIKAPNSESLKLAREISREAGDFTFLSNVDVQILALALELKKLGYKPLIVTDDYSIQNIADQMGIQFIPLATLGIRYRLQWTLYCPACHKNYPPDYKDRLCEICGTELKRKPVRRKNLRDKELH